MSANSKRCCKCRKVKPLSDFHRQATRVDGHQNRCKPCILEYQREGRRRGSDLADAAKQVSVSLERFQMSCLQLSVAVNETHDAAKRLLAEIEDARQKQGASA